MYFIDSEKKRVWTHFDPYHPFVTPPFLGIKADIPSPLCKPDLSEKIEYTGCISVNISLKEGRYST